MVIVASLVKSFFLADTDADAPEWRGLKGDLESCSGTSGVTRVGGACRKDRYIQVELESNLKAWSQRVTGHKHHDQFWHRKSDAPPPRALSPTRYSAFFEFRSPLDMRRDVQEILQATPHHKQVMIFSATLAKEIPGMCKKFMANVSGLLDSGRVVGCRFFLSPRNLGVDVTKLTLHGLQQYYVKLEETGKNRKLNELLDTLDLGERTGQAPGLVQLPEYQHSLRPCAGGAAFEKRILVATDIFGRGIDVERVNIVINYDCPPDADSYLHCVG
ncbi:hypothetical protein C8R44DRAFT_913313 [Mycena epipterygia]|nr:hypothetical protein C8R44DRAFT_913313 [Mycena epipterygia]